MLRYVLIVLTVMLSFSAVQAQVSYESFYSRSGLGDIQDLGNTQLQSSGWLKSTKSAPYYVNHFNPASYAHLTATAIDIGLSASRSNISLEEESRSFWQGNIDYLSIAFPLINPLNKLLDREVHDFKLGMNIAIIPYTRVGYKTSILDSVSYSTGSLPYLREYSGEGGLSRVIGGIGAHYEDISFGVNIGYTFGTIQTEEVASFPVNLIDFLNDYYDNSERYSGFYYRLGAMYDYYLHKDLEDSRNNIYLTFGLTYEGKQKTRVTLEESHLKYSGINLSSGVTLTNGYAALDAIENVRSFEDTISISEVTKHATLPSHLGIGLTYIYKNKFKAGLDLETVSWSNYENEVRPEDLKNSFKISGGVEYIPNETSYTNGWQRIRYRGGIKYELDPRSENGVQLKQYGINAGLGIPIYFSRQVSFINLGVGYNHIQADVSKSSALSFQFGFTLNNNLWFYKRRFD